jgi:hypothetical protein
MQANSIHLDVKKRTKIGSTAHSLDRIYAKQNKNEKSLSRKLKK